MYSVYDAGNAVTSPVDFKLHYYPAILLGKDASRIVYYQQWPRGGRAFSCGINRERSIAWLIGKEKPRFTDLGWCMATGEML